MYLQTAYRHLRMCIAQHKTHTVKAYLVELLKTNRILALREYFVLFT